MLMYCGKSNIPIGARVRIVSNIGNQCEPFIDCTGITTHPFKKGCRKENWVGVELEQQTIYGQRFNFHVEEIEIIDDCIY